MGAARGPRATEATRKARATAAKGRHAATGREGTRTPFGIRYDGGYAKAKQAHGVGNMNLYGMEQHTHMLDTMMVKAGQYTVSEDIPPDSVAVGTAAPMPMRRRFWTSWRAAASRGALVAWRQVA